MNVSKIVITGGPCAGKSTALERVKSEFSKMGYEVLFVAETATELISGGVTPWTCASSEEFQRCVLQLQVEKERIFEKAAKTMRAEKVLIVCDRGALDGKAYMTEAEFSSALELVGSNEVALRDQYGAVFHLVSVAKGAAEFYTTNNNSARTETLSEAAALDEKLISAWTGHPHFRVIGNCGTFEEKMKCLMAEIAAFLGEPEPCEFDGKVLIKPQGHD